MAAPCDDEDPRLYDPSSRLLSRSGTEDSTVSASSTDDRSGGIGGGITHRRKVLSGGSDQRFHLHIIISLLLTTVLLFAFVHKHRHNHAAATSYVTSSRVAAFTNGTEASIWGDQPPQSSLSNCNPVVAEPPSEPPVHPLLERVIVSISANWDVTRLTYLERVLIGINEWKSPRVDVCIGSNRHDLHEVVLQGSLKKLNASGNIRTCPLPGNLFHPSALNWRSREILGVKYEDLEANYTSFIFLEDDLVLSWDALVAWAEDTTLLEPYGLKRSFYRTEIWPESGEPMHQEFVDGDRNVQHVVIPVGAGEKGGSLVEARRFVQLASYTYAGMFVATRSQFRRYLTSGYWKVEDGGRCCDPGAREFASWGFLFFEVPNDQWGTTGLIPWDEEKKAMDPIAMIMHRPNNYVIQGGTKASKTSVKGVEAIMSGWIDTHPPAPALLHDFDKPPTRQRALRSHGGEEEERRWKQQEKEAEERRLERIISAARRLAAARDGLVARGPQQ